MDPVDDVHDYPFMLTARLLTDSHDGLESLREDVGGAMRDLLHHAPRTMGAMTCSAQDAGALLEVHCSFMLRFLASLDRLRVSVIMLRDTDRATHHDGL